MNAQATSHTAHGATGVPWRLVLKGTTRLPWHEGSIARQPAGSPKGGEFAPKGTGGGATGEGKANGASTDPKRFADIKTRWATLNNQLLGLKDHPNNPEAQAIIKEQIAITKEIYSMNVDPGGVGVEGLGKPGGIRDIVIVGAGPGGMTAAIHGGVEGYDTLLIEASLHVGGQAKYSARIENVPEAGFPAGLSGEQLATAMLNDVQRSRAEVMLGVKVTNLSVDPDTEVKTLTLSDGTTIQSRTVILAGGLQPRKAEFPGADSPDVHVMDSQTLVAEGAGGEVIVVGGSNGAAQAALAAAQKSHVVLLSRSPLDKGMSEYQRTQIENAQDKIEVIHDEIASLQKNEKGEAVSVTLKNGKVLKVDEVGLFLGGLPSTEWLPPSVERIRPDAKAPKGGFVTVDRDLETSLPGVFAVGDIRSSGETDKKQPGAERRKRPQSGSNGRIAAAIGDAAIAVRNTYAYFEHLANIEQTRLQPAVAKSDHWGEARIRKASMKKRLFRLYDDLGALDIDNPWYGQTVEPLEDDVPIVLKSEEQRIVYGEVYAPNRPDAQGEYMTAVEIRKMAHEFIRSGKMGKIDLMHGNKCIEGASVVESFVSDATDSRFLPDSWVIGVHIPDADIWGKIKKNEINGFSMEALVTRHDTDVEVDIPPVVRGMTSKHSDGHHHEFFVTYDEKGDFKGGMTDVVNGHSHSIVAGTHTQDSQQHRHRFSSVDNVKILS